MSNHIPVTQCLGVHNIRFRLAPQLLDLLLILLGVALGLLLYPGNME